jgi:hypothetical protein
MRYENKYNRLVADRLFEWHSDEWIIDRHGNITLREDMADYSQDNSITPLFSYAPENTI